MSKKLSPEEIEEICENMLPVGAVLSVFLSKHHIVFLETKENQLDDGDDEE
jgi:hypothetical protein